jgi:hypothetical protein
MLQLLVLVLTLAITTSRLLVVLEGDAISLAHCPALQVLTPDGVHQAFHTQLSTVKLQP